MSLQRNSKKALFETTYILLHTKPYFNSILAIFLKKVPPFAICPRHPRLFLWEKEEKKSLAERMVGSEENKAVVGRSLWAAISRQKDIDLRRATIEVLITFPLVVDA
ncbi:hypothetical protein CEXT_227591 [Caerostris extrusa]|uniref:Uncharacterized protein n=1 Tax=Caerostris extrusa TaxID=172846 RepID=A0AAV4QVZ8_CAEEX|nr:hypothetical protein CEXT_227591 [Caerostris extrusa]